MKKMSLVAMVMVVMFSTGLIGCGYKIVKMDSSDSKPVEKVVSEPVQTKKSVSQEKENQQEKPLVKELTISEKEAALAKKAAAIAEKEVALAERSRYHDNGDVELVPLNDSHVYVKDGMFQGVPSVRGVNVEK